MTIIACKHFTGLLYTDMDFFLGEHEFIKRNFDSLGAQEFIKRNFDSLGANEFIKRLDSLGQHEFIKRFLNEANQEQVTEN